MELEIQFRNAIQDTEEDYLYPKEEVFLFANEAINEACRRSNLKVMTDVNNPLSTIDLVPGQNTYAVSDKVYNVLAYRLKTDTKFKTLPVKDFRELDQCYGDWMSKNGEPVCVVAGLNSGKVMLYKNPTVADKLVMTVRHLPETELVDDMDIPDIPSHLHSFLIYWMLFRGYSKNDSEMKNEKLAQLNLQLFERKFGNDSEANARNEQYNLMSSANNYGIY